MQKMASSAAAATSPGILLFYQTKDIYSQFHPCNFIVNGVGYNCCEQYMMHQKALTFNDEEMAQKILAESKPGKIKSLGRQVHDFDDNVWISKVRDIIYEGNLAKFSQIPYFKQTLLATGDKILAEASPSDRRYGIGLGKQDPRALDPDEWLGTNWLGEAIMRVRDQLRREGNG